MQKLKAIDRTTLFARKQRTIIPLVCNWCANWVFRILRYNFVNFHANAYRTCIYIYISLMHARNSSSNFHSSYINYRIFVRWSPLDGTSPLPPSGFQNSFDAFVNPLRENRSSLASAKEQREKRGGRGCKRWRNVEEICRGWQPPPPTRQFGCRNIFGETSITHILVRNSFPVWKASVGMPSPPYPPSSNAPHSSPLLLLLSFDACWRRCNRCCVRAHRIRMHMYGNGGRGRRGRGLMQRLLTFSNARWPATHATDSKIVP